MRERTLNQGWSKPREGGIERNVAIKILLGAEGANQVDLPLDAASLNESLYEIGIWLIEREIPHQARVVMEPEHGRIRVCFPDASDAKAFRERFSVRLN
jgi:hypothetical protein